MDRPDGAGPGVADGVFDEPADPAGIPQGESAAVRKSGRGAVVALSLLVVAAVGAFALIGWDATRSSGAGRPGDAGTVRTPAVTGDPTRAGQPSGPDSAAPDAPENGSGGAARGRGDTATDPADRQRENVRRSLNDPHPRPPMENPVTQDDLDRERDRNEPRVSPVPAVNEPPPPGGIGTPQG